MRKAAIGILCVFGVVLFWACQGTDVPTNGASRSGLRAVGGCDDLETMLRDAAIEAMRTEVMANYERVIEGECYWHEYGDAYDAGADADVDADADADGDGDTDSDSDPDDGAEEFSTTNVQEIGVDEADFVKNDGNYIYIVGGNEFLIIDAWPASTMDIVSRVEFDGRPTSLYVYEDHAVIYTTSVTHSDRYVDDCYYDDWSFEYVCGATNGETNIFVYDISDRAHPVLERELSITGLYVNSRRVEDFVHTVMTYPEVTFTDLRYWPEGIDTCSEDDRATIWRAFTDLIAENTRIINEAPLEDWIPTMTDTTYAPDGTAESTRNVLEGCRGFYEATESSGRSFLSVLSFDLIGDGAANVTSIVGNQGTVYASRESLYVASRTDGYDLDETTTFHKFAFDLDEPATIYRASGVVPGRILNQFSMSEYRGYLRVATTIGYLPDPECTNNVYVLDSRDRGLEIVGEVTGIAPTEDIRSARFMGNRGFLVTFKKTDPLFTVDLSDPENPFIVGELHIPGYSTYMHMMDEDHLLAIGFDAQDEGSFAWFQGVQLQIFDVSDMSTPTRTHLEIIGTRGTTSEATANHLAFNYFRPHDLLAIPMAICEESSSGGSYGDTMTFNGLLVYDVTAEDGFSEHGRISHGDPGAGYSCSNWWTSPNSQVKRSIIMDDFVFSIATDQIIAAQIDDLATPVSTVELPTP